MSREKNEVQLPEGTLWAFEPYWRAVSSEEWEKAAKVLHDLTPLGDHLGVGLEIALVDAVLRCREEARRARERETSEKNEHGLSPEEDERLRGLLRRSDATNDARTPIEDGCQAGADSATTLEWLGRIHAEAEAEFQRYRRDLGIDDERPARAPLRPVE